MKRKKTCFLLIPALCALLLSGCGRLQADRREIARLCVVQTLGVDPAPGGVLVTLSSSAMPGEDAVCISGTGPSISAAIESARREKPDRELFLGHLQTLLIGEEAARQGIRPYLTYVCRSGDLRLSMPVYILREGKAQDLMSAAGSEGISALLQTIEQGQRSCGSGKNFSAADILQRLSRSGSALVCALSGAVAEKEEDAPPALELAAEGYAVLQGDKLSQWAGADTAVGIDLLRNDSGIRKPVVHDRFDAPVTLELTGGKSRLQPLWGPDGNLREIEIYADVDAVILETGAGTDLSSPVYADHLVARLETAVSDEIGNALRLSRSLGTDFLGLGDRIEQLAPLAFRQMPTDFSALLPALELSVAVHGTLRHGSDLN